jgi:deoxyribodipyrimidine photo-lyase
MRIHWHRRDLRVDDNVALAEAAAEGTVVPLFVFDDDVLAHAAPPRVAFMLDALAALRELYRERGSDLVVRRGDPAEVVPDVAAEYGAEAVHWNRDYSGLASERDAAVRRALSDDGVVRSAHHDALLHEPGSITTNDGTHYGVYSYFWKKWVDRPKDDSRDAPSPDSLADVDGGPLPSLSDLGFDEPEAVVPVGGQGEARRLLESFCDGPVYGYDDRRDYPAVEGTSRLSPHLKFGTLGVRRAYEATATAKAEADDEDAAAGVDEFQQQLAWREFYAHVLAARPDVVTDNYREYEHDVEWRDDPEGLQAWRDGETGFPVIDAGMRQLRQEAWMHNRMRMAVASFLTKDLMVDWRAGYDWFREKLVDHDPANDSGGWQWAASTGTDAQPYFRIFNPWTQGERFDQDGEYVREYVPELSDASAEEIHGWGELDDDERDRVAPEYPAPILDHAERREQALSMFQTARGETEE